MNLSLIERKMKGWVNPPWLQRLLVKAERRRWVGFRGAVAKDMKLFLDLSAITRHDAGTGIQRLVRSVSVSLSENPPPGWTVLPCAAGNGKYGLIQSRSPIDGGARESLDPCGGDVFLGLDFSLDSIPRNKRQLLHWKKNGVRLWFVMYDLLPQQRPDWFSDKLVIRYLRWLQVISEVADGFFCISPSVTKEMQCYLSRHLRLPSELMPELVTLPMGWDICRALHSSGISENFEILLRSMKNNPMALMVGTLEPRKGHADVLEAFQKLWDAGYPGQLVIVGRPGWKTEPLQHALRNHVLFEKKLFWFNAATDDEVQTLYSACDGVIVASHGEGFGLPVVEALGHGKPVLARNIDVFHTIDSDGISYFPETAGATELAEAIRQWLSCQRQGQKGTFRMNLSSWDDTAKAIISGLQK